MSFILTEGERHEATAFFALLGKRKVKRFGGGRPKHRCSYFLGDQAYSSRQIRQALRQPGITPVISRRRNEKTSTVI